MDVAVYRKTDQTKLVVVRPSVTYLPGGSTGPTGPPGPRGVQGTRGSQGATGPVGTINNYFLTYVTDGSWTTPMSNPFTVALGTDLDIDFPTSGNRPWLKGQYAGYYSILVKASMTLAKTGSTAIGPDCQLRLTLNTNNGGDPLAAVQHAWADSANSSETTTVSFSCVGYLGVQSSVDRFKVTLTREGPSGFTLSVNWAAVMLHPMGTFATGPAGVQGLVGRQGTQGVQGIQGYRGAPGSGYTTYNQIPAP